MSPRSLDALVDCSSFYCSCERAFDPSLRTRPVVVLSNNDGCVDGYVREGQYYSGSPVVQQTNVAYTGERG